MKIIFVITLIYSLLLTLNRVATRKTKKMIKVRKKWGFLKKSQENQEKIYKDLKILSF